MNLKRYTVEDVEQNQFYQLPKFLFYDEFKCLSNDARVLYSLLRDRHQLSIKNNWVNGNNEVFLIYTRDEMCDMLGISNKTVLKAIKQLKDLKLFEEVRQGINKPNLIYLTHEDVENTGQGNFTRQDKEILHGNKTDINNTDNNIRDFKYNRKHKDGTLTDYQAQTVADMANIENIRKRKEV